MRLLHSLLLALGCFALVLQSNAADIPAKQTYVSTEYRAGALHIPQEGLNDYHHSTTFSLRNTIANKLLDEETVYINSNAAQDFTGFILNDHFHSIRSLLSEEYAKNFRGKLIFPQHYHW
jgi:hypothetical protein